MARSSSKRITSRHMDITRLCNAWMLMVLCVATVSISTANAVASSTVANLDQKSTSSAPGTSTQSAPATPHQLAGHKDDIYIDDDALEGSGHGGHGDDLDREPDYSGSGLGPDDEDSRSVTNSRKNHFGSKYPKHSSNADKDNHEDLDGSGDGGVVDLRNENDDDEDNRFGNTHVKLPKPTHSTPVPVVPIKADNDLQIVEDPKPEDDLDLDRDNEEDVEEEEEDEDEGGDDETPEENGEEDDYGVDKDPKNPHPTDDEDVEIDKNDEDEEKIHRGLDPYPVDKEHPGGSGVSATGGSSGTTQDKSNEVFIMNKNEDRTTSFFSQPGILAAVIGGAVVGLLCAILVVMFIVYRMRKKDEGSYALDEPKRSPAGNSYAKNTNNREFYA